MGTVGAELPEPYLMDVSVYSGIEMSYTNCRQYTSKYATNKHRKRASKQRYYHYEVRTSQPYSPNLYLQRSLTCRIHYNNTCTLQEHAKHRDTTTSRGTHNIPAPFRQAMPLNPRILSRVNLTRPFDVDGLPPDKLIAKQCWWGLLGTKA